MSRHKRVRAEGIEFLFKYEEDVPEILHIYARHLKEPADAIEVFFEGNTTYNDSRKRFETRTEKETLYWFWFQTDRTVYVISCFDNE